MVACVHKCNFEDESVVSNKIGEIGHGRLRTDALAVHWYFPTKDDLFAAVLERVFGEAIAEVEASDPAPRDRLEALLPKTQKYRVLRREAYERIEESEALRAVYSGLLQ
jgi:hypothetical protein